MPLARPQQGLTSISRRTNARCISYTPAADILAGVMITKDSTSLARKISIAPEKSVDDEPSDGYQREYSDIDGDSDDPIVREFLLMSRGRQNFKQGDVTKAIKAAVKAGARVARVEIVEGRIIVHVEEQNGGSKPATAGSSEWE